MWRRSQLLLAHTSDSNYEFFFNESFFFLVPLRCSSNVCAEPSGRRKWENPFWHLIQLGFIPFNAATTKPTPSPEESHIRCRLRYYVVKRRNAGTRDGDGWSKRAGRFDGILSSKSSFKPDQMEWGEFNFCNYFCSSVLFSFLRLEIGAFECFWAHSLPIWVSIPQNHRKRAISSLASAQFPLVLIAKAIWRCVEYARLLIMIVNSSRANEKWRVFLAANFVILVRLCCLDKDSRRATSHIA